MPPASVIDLAAAHCFHQLHHGHGDEQQNVLQDPELQQPHLRPARATAFQALKPTPEQVGPTGFEPEEDEGMDKKDMLQWKKDALEPEEGVGLFSKLFGKKRKKAPGLPGGAGDDDEALLHSITKARAAAKQADDAAERATEAVRLALLRAKGIPEAVAQTEDAWKGAESAAWLASTRPKLDSAFEGFRAQQEKASQFLNVSLKELTDALQAPKSNMQANQLFQARTKVMEAEKEVKMLMEEQVPAFERAHHTYQANLAHAIHPENHVLEGQVTPHEISWPPGQLGIWPAAVRGPRVAGPGDAGNMPETGLDFLQTMQEADMRERMKPSLIA